MRTKVQMHAGMMGLLFLGLVEARADLPPVPQAEVRQRIGRMNAYLKEKGIVGQPHARSAIRALFMRSMTGTGSERSTGKVLLFGPLGMGKTTLPQLSAEAAGFAYKHLPMKDYSTPGSALKLEKDIFDALAADPRAVIHPDGIEKAHPFVQARLAELMEFWEKPVVGLAPRGHLKVTNRHAIFIVSTAAGQGVMQGGTFYPFAERQSVGFAYPERTEPASGVRPFSKEEILALMESDGLSKELSTSFSILVGMPRPTPQEFVEALMASTEASLNRESARLGVKLKLKNPEGFIQSLLRAYSPYESSYATIEALLQQFLEPALSELAIDPNLKPGADVAVVWKGFDKIGDRGLADCMDFLF